MFQQPSPKKLAWKKAQERRDAEITLMHTQHPTAQDRFLAYERAEQSQRHAAFRSVS